MSKTILSVNGNKSMNYLLNTIITHQHQFIPVSDIFSAMKELKKNSSISVVLLDIDTNIDESLDFIHHLQTSSLFNVSIITLSGNKSSALRKSLEVDLCVHEFFYKPFNPVDILKSIEKASLVETTLRNRLSVIAS